MTPDQIAEYVRCPVCFGAGRIEHPASEMTGLLAFMEHRLGMSRQEQAEHLGVSRRAISAWISGASTPTEEHMERAKAIAMFWEPPRGRGRKSYAQSDGVALENPGDFEAPGRGRKVSGSAPGTPVKRAVETTAPEQIDGSQRG